VTGDRCGLLVERGELGLRGFSLRREISEARPKFASPFVVDLVLAGRRRRLGSG
jgi:hypothetical protein